MVDYANFGGLTLRVMGLMRQDCFSTIVLDPNGKFPKVLQQIASVHDEVVFDSEEVAKAFLEEVNKPKLLSRITSAKIIQP